MNIADWLSSINSETAMVVLGAILIVCGPAVLFWAIRTSDPSRRQRRLQWNILFASIALVAIGIDQRLSPGGTPDSESNALLIALAVVIAGLSAIQLFKAYSRPGPPLT